MSGFFLYLCGFVDSIVCNYNSMFCIKKLIFLIKYDTKYDTPSAREFLDRALDHNADIIIYIAHIKLDPL